MLERGVWEGVGIGRRTGGRICCVCTSSSSTSGADLKKGWRGGWGGRGMWWSWRGGGIDRCMGDLCDFASIHRPRDQLTNSQLKIPNGMHLLNIK